jgi:hypothetical protein
MPTLVSKVEAIGWRELGLEQCTIYELMSMEKLMDAYVDCDEQVKFERGVVGRRDIRLSLLLGVKVSAGYSRTISSVGVLITHVIIVGRKALQSRDGTCVPYYCHRR